MHRARAFPLPPDAQTAPGQFVAGAYENCFCCPQNSVAQDARKRTASHRSRRKIVRRKRQMPQGSDWGRVLHKKLRDTNKPTQQPQANKARRMDQPASVKYTKITRYPRTNTLAIRRCHTSRRNASPSRSICPAVGVAKCVPITSTPEPARFENISCLVFVDCTGS